MSMYDNNDKDNLYYELEQFMENHTITELLEIVTDIVNSKEYDMR